MDTKGGDLENGRKQLNAAVRVAVDHKLNVVGLYRRRGTVGTFSNEMALVHNMSETCVKSELDIYTVPVTQVSVDRSTYQEIPPVSAITETAPIEFYVTGSSEDYIDLNNTHIFIRAKITKSDGTNIANDAKVGFVNYPGASIFSQVDIMLGDTLITHSSSTYPYRALFECLLNYTPDTLSSQFGCGLFAKDTAGSMDATDPAGDNKGLAARAGHTERSRVVELIAPIHADMFFQEKLLINGVDIKIKFIRAKDEFSLMADDPAEGYKINILSASLYIKKVSIAPGIRLAHAKTITHTNAKYPIERVCLKNYSIPTGTRVCNQENLFLGQIPKFVVIAFVDNDGFTGAYGRNPFNFKHYNLEYLCLHADGQSFPSRPFQPDYANNHYAREYFQLFDGTGRYLKDKPLSITRREFGSGYTLYCFNLEADGGSGGSHVSLVRSGNVRLEARFRTALTRTVNLICYSVFDSILEISGRRQVLLDHY